MHKNNKFTTVLATFAFLVLAVSIIPAVTNAAGTGGFTNFSTLFTNLISSKARSNSKVISGTVTNTDSLAGKDLIDVTGNADVEDGDSTVFHVYLASSVGTPQQFAKNGFSGIVPRPGTLLSLGVDATNVVNSDGSPSYIQGEFNGQIKVGDVVTMQGTMTGSDYSSFVATTIIDKTLIQKTVFTGKVGYIDLADQGLVMTSTTGIPYYVIVGFTGGNPSTVHFIEAGRSILGIAAVTSTKNATIPFSNIRVGDTLTVLGIDQTAAALYASVSITPILSLPPSTNYHNAVFIEPIVILDQNPSSLKGGGGGVDSPSIPRSGG